MNNMNNSKDILPAPIIGFSPFGEDADEGEDNDSGEVMDDETTEEYTSGDGGGLFLNHDWGAVVKIYRAPLLCILMIILLGTYRVLLQSQIQRTINSIFDSLFPWQVLMYKAGARVV